MALTLDHVVSTTVFMQDLNDFTKMNGVCATYFKEAPQARATCAGRASAA